MACEGLCKWCLAIYDYYFVHKSILPLRGDLADATKKLDVANKELHKEATKEYNHQYRIDNIDKIFLNIR